MTTSPHRMNDGVTTATHRRLEEALEIASRLAGTEAIGAVHVTVAERPSYDELQRYRRIADANGLSLTMTATSIILRPRPVNLETAEQVPAPGLAALLPSLGGVASETWRRVHDRTSATGAVDRARLSVRWLHDRAAAWNAGFQGLNEGTR